MRHPLRQMPEALPATHFVNYPELTALEDEYVLMQGIGVLLTVAGLFKYLVPFPKMGILVHTIANGGSDLFTFVALLVVLLLSYTIMGHLLFGHVMADYASCGQSLIAVAQLALGESNYYELEAASGPIAAGIYYWTFMLTITIVFVNMVLAILFSTYDTLQEAISQAEEIHLGGFMLRAVLLGREPSLYEQQLDIYAVVKSTSTFRLLGLGDGARHRGVRVAPSLPVGADARGGRSESFAAAVEAGTLTSKTFAESHLLKLLDPDYSYRLFGALSNKTDNKLLLAKAQVLELRTSEAFSMRRTSVAVQMKAQQENFEAAAKAAQARHEATVAELAEEMEKRGSGISSTFDLSKGVDEDEEDEGESDGEDNNLASEEEEFKDKRITLDVDEFCALLHMLDDDSADIDIGHRSAQAESFKLGERSDEMRISEMVFEQFARPAEQNKELHFRKLVAEEFRQIRQAHGKHTYRQEEALKRMCKALQVEFPAATDEHSNPRQGGGRGSVVAPPPASRMVPQQAPRQAPPPLHRESSESSFTTM
mmetsp:Transcript_103971/g.299363  ORF Transcript_103971/g.299363 Transcript_103971/m.299363 type:complete len:539 (-) Transcript_103971:155-1771(-)